MGLRRFVLGAMSSATIFTALGCAPRYVAPPPPPPPSPMVGLAEHNGYDTGRSDGERAAAEGRAPDPRRTHAYADTPGFQEGMGPFRVYQDAFRDAYLRGYDKGFRHER